MLREKSFLQSVDNKKFSGLLVRRLRLKLLPPLFIATLVTLAGVFLIGTGFGSVAASQTTFIVSLYPPPEWVGWVASNQPESSHFGDSALYAGLYNNATYHSLVRFDLQEIAGAPLRSANLRLSGLSQEWLGEGGTWTVELLESDPADIPSEVDTFGEIQKASASSDVSFTVESTDLGAGLLNEFTFNEEQLALLAERAAQTGRVTFRLSGPADDENALFVWDSGYGLSSRGLRPELIVEMGPVAVPPDGAQFVKQSVPAEMVAGEVYTVTLTMKNSGTSTWSPKGAFGYILGSQNPPGNETWGTNTASLPETVPPGQTVDITFSVEAPSKASSYDFQWQMVHSNVGWFGEMSEKVTVQVVSPSSIAPTSTPLAVPFATPTMTPVLTATPTPDWSVIPSEWKGRVLFKSDRDGGKAMSEFTREVRDYKPILEKAGIYPGKSDWERDRNWRNFWFYIMDADGTNVEQLTGPDLYIAALYRETLDPSREYQVFVSEPRDPDYDKQVGKNYEISLRRLSDGYEWYITGGTPGADYQPAYCQANPRYIAYTSQQTYNDDIFVVDILSSAAPPLETQLTSNPDYQDWVWDKHASWSPDCDQIAFYSNRTGRDQVWVMEFWSMEYPGQNLRTISDGKYNDLDPVWIK
jgi:hypothetical protein